MTKKSKYIFGVTAVIAAAVMWGLDGVLLTPNLLDKNGIPLDVLIVVFILHIIPFIIMNFIWFKSYRAIKRFTTLDLIVMLIISITGGTFGTICIVKALFLVNFHNLTIVALLQKLQPVFAILLSVIILKEKLTKRYFLWATITIIAGYIMTFGFNLPNKTSGNIVEAAIYALLAALFFGTSTVLSKKMLIKYTPSETTFFRYGFTSIIVFILILTQGNINLIETIPQRTWIIFLIIAFTTGSGAILLYYHGLKYINASVSTICELFFPITTAVFDYIVNDNTMTWIQWTGAVIMIFAIIRLTREGSINEKQATIEYKT